MGILNQIVGQQPFLSTQVQPHPGGFLLPHAPPPFWDPKQQQQPGQQPGQQGQQPGQQPGGDGGDGGSQRDIWDHMLGGHSGMMHSIFSGKPGMGNSAGGPPMSGAPIHGSPAPNGVMGSIMQAFNGAGGAAGAGGMGLDAMKLLALMG
jgi:hypothetical protein